MARLRGPEGALMECAICMEEMRVLTSEWTPCCTQALHAHCLRGLVKCPLCRSRWQHAPPDGDDALATALAASEEEAVSTSSSRAARNYERALDLAFSGPQWQSDLVAGVALGSTNSVMGTNYGWRTGGPTSTLYTV